MSSSQQLRASRPQPPPLPEAQSLEVDGKAIIKYIDLKPADYSAGTTPTIVLVHGSPGNYKDFRYLIPLLQKDARVITLNLPGFDDSVVIDEANRFEHVTALGVAKIAYEVLAKLCEDGENVFIVGHSFGGHTTTNLAHLNLTEKKLNIRGVGLLASAGHREHRTLWPVTINTLSSVVQANVPIISSVAQSVVHVMYTKIVGFPNNNSTTHFVSALIRTSSTDYALVNQQRKEIAQIPAFVAWAKDDPHIEEELSLRLSEEFHPGPRFAFDKGGHNIQKTKADVLSLELMRWIHEVVAGAKEEPSSSSVAAA